MSAFLARCELPVSADQAFAWHARAGALERLMPPWMDTRIVERSGGIADGARVVLSVPVGPLHWRWVAVHRDQAPGRQFCDEQVTGPFAAWTHLHRFTPLPELNGTARCMLEDHIDYRLPAGAIGRILLNCAVERDLGRVFAWRHQRTLRDLERHRAFAMRPRLRVVLSGASGMVGSALAAFLASGGHRVQRLTRGEVRGGDSIAWNPTTGEVDAAALDGCDAVVHLAGHNLAGARWSAAQKSRIRDSRIGPTHALCAALAGLPNPPRVLIAASAVGFYGAGDDTVLDEEAPSGAGFLAEVCRAWEAACEPARNAGIRVVHLRLGMVLSAAGGALRKMLTPFRLGLGGRLGDGRQWMSWIDLDDAIAAINHLLFAEQLSGAVNATAPMPTTNRDFARTLAAALHRPCLAPIPAAMVRLLFGEMGQALLLDGARVLPRRLTESGFHFATPDLKAALGWQLGLEGA